MVEQPLKYQREEFLLNDVEMVNNKATGPGRSHHYHRSKQLPVYE